MSRIGVYDPAFDRAGSASLGRRRCEAKKEDTDQKPESEKR